MVVVEEKGGSSKTQLKPQSAVGSGVSQKGTGSGSPGGTRHSKHHEHCPECGSLRIWKDGLRTTGLGPVQRYLCRECGYRFSEGSRKTSFNGSGMSDGLQRVQRIQTKAIYSCSDKPLFCLVSAAQTKGAKNLAEKQETQTRQEKAAGATTPTPADVKGKIVEFLWHLKKQGYAESTIRSYVYLLKILAKRGADILDPENVKTIIAEQPWDRGRKHNAVKAYTAFLRMQDKKWDKPKYNPKKGLPRPPTTEQVKQLVAGSSKKYAPIFRFMAETGASPVEVSIMLEKSFDFERYAVYIEGRKGHLDRVVPMSQELIALMRTYLVKYGRFPSGDKMGQKWRKYRDRLALKLNDMGLKHIRLYDLRHYFGTMLYLKTNNLLYVKDQMGHIRIETTMIYTKLVQFPVDEEFTTAVAKNLEEARKLIEAGFERHDEFNGVHIYRKRKALLKGLWSSEKGSWSSLV